MLWVVMTATNISSLVKCLIPSLTSGSQSLACPNYGSYHSQLLHSVCLSVLASFVVHCARTRSHSILCLIIYDLSVSVTINGMSLMLMCHKFTAIYYSSLV